MSDASDKELDLSQMRQVGNWRKLFPSSPQKPAWGNWNHQYKAYQFATRYLTLAEGKKTDEAALIRMPTGSGKTGVMALIANYRLKGKGILIVVPSTYLTTQVGRALKYGFWKISKKKPPGGPRDLYAFLPSSIEDILDKNKRPLVLLCTTTTLSDLHMGRAVGGAAAFGALREAVATVLVDEGHREPARTWAKAIRDLGRPTILFSATPYRNDLRMFKIGWGKDHRYSVRFQESIESAVIRDVVFRYPAVSFVSQNRGNREETRRIEVFVRELQAYYYGDLQKEKPKAVETPKVIVRCSNVGSIRSLHNALVRAEARRLEGLTRGGSTAGGGMDPNNRVLSIHEDFNGADNHFGHVPDLEADSTKEAVFWIHQYKLTEGIDDSNFCLVAFFEPFGNSRSLVQQIGRVLRNRLQTPGELAMVFSDPFDGLEAEWKGYREFELSKQDVIGAEDIVRAIRDAQPKRFYANGRYRKGADFDDDSIWSDLRVPASARIYERPEGFTAADLEELVREMSECLDEDQLVEVRILEQDHDNGSRSAVIVHWEIAQSEKIEEGAFFNVGLVLTLFHLNERHVFYQGRVGLEAIGGKKPLQLVDIRQLEKLIPRGDATLKQLSLVNCDLGDTAVRRRALGGRALEASAAALNDHLHFISSVACQCGSQSRYVGLRQSRVTDRIHNLLTLDEFSEWAAQLSERLSAMRVKKHAMLRRYASPVFSPGKAVARHLLLDLADFRGEFAPTSGNYGPAFADEFVATACDVGEDGSFVCEINDTEIRGTISYEYNRFRITSDDLNTYFRHRLGNNKKPATYLSSPSIMRVVTEDGLLYNDGRFFRPTSLHGANRVHDLDLVKTVSGLQNITKKEKGEKGRIGRGTWQSGSLFNLIDNDEELFRICDSDPDLLVCDDLSTEVGDFVAVDSNKRKIIVLHAKVFASLGSISAKEMHEVVAQAKKNLGFLDPAERPPPGRAAKWDEPWKTEGRELGRIRRRQQAGQDGKSIMDVIQSLLHSTSVQKEVWLVLGNAFSEAQLKRVIMMETIEEWHWIQLLYLIHSCQASVAALGARLRILTGG